MIDCHHGQPEDAPNFPCSTRNISCMTHPGVGQNSQNHQHITDQTSDFHEAAPRAPQVVYPKPPGGNCQPAAFQPGSSHVSTSKKKSKLFVNYLNLFMAILLHT